MSRLILVTGSSGFIGSKITVTTLRGGYSVRAAVRSESKAAALLAAPNIQAINPGDRLTFAIVPNMDIPGAYDNAVQGVNYIIHCAAPVGFGIPIDKLEAEIADVIVNGIVMLLDLTFKTPGIQRVVLTSSMFAIASLKELVFDDTDTVYNEQYETLLPQAPYNHHFEAYASAKVRALVASKDFIKQKRPEWDAVYIMASYVIGDNEMLTIPNQVLDSTSAAAFAQVLGKEWVPVPVPGISVHVDDVAKLHILALDERIKGGESFIASSGSENGTIWNEAIEIVNKNFPDAVKSGILPNNASAPTKKVRVDASKAEIVFRFKFKSYEEQVISVTRQYLELLAKQSPQNS